MLKLLIWLDENIICLLAGFLLLFIPLYPKLPLLDVLPGYIVRVRLEDFIVSFTILLWIIWIWRKKVKFFGNPLIKPISLYLIVGFLSMVSAVLLIHTVPMELLHIQKMVLHFLRRIEYLSLFFIFYSTLRSIRQFKIYIGIIVLTVIGVSLYGFGQKYLYWPAFSTMNREFSKGWMLYLTEHARVLSTFGGHYDLAAFIMMALIILWSLFWSVKKWFLKLGIFLVLSAAFWTLILTASRTSFIAYLAGITLMFFFWAYKKGIVWSLSRWFAVVFLSILVMLSFGDLSERFTKLLKIDERVSGIKRLLLSPIGAPPSDKAVFLENNPQSTLAQITSRSDQPPVPLRPSDVFQDIPLLVPEGTGSATLAAVKRTYSKTAFMYDLSTAIRFDALWPQALRGFKRNPLLGSGYSTLNKTQVNEFTEAESTDNDYLRNLGETGILGFVTFYGTIFLTLFIIWRNLAIIRDPIVFGIVIALAGLILGLLVNAVYIDVFESSKVAFYFWAVTGFVLAGIDIIRKGRKEPIPPPQIPGLTEFKNNLKIKSINFFRSDLFALLLILILAFSLRLYKINTPLADWHSWRQADTSAVTRNYVKNGINFLYPTFDDLSNVASGRDNPKGLRYVEFPLYNAAGVFIDKLFVGYNIEISERLTSILATLGSVIFLFLIVRKYRGRKEAIFAAAFFSVIPYSIFFTRVILPEPFLVFTSLGMVYFFDKFIEKTTKFQLTLRGCTLKVQSEKVQSEMWQAIKIIVLFILALLFTVSSLLIKPFAAFLFIPMVYLWFKWFGISIKSTIGLLGYLVIGLLPFILWRFWISQYPEGIPASFWLLNGDGIRFKGAFFYWIFADRLGRLILGYWGLPLLIGGILAPFKKEKYLFHLWGIAILLYVTVFATGNVRHDYYQLFTIPIIAVYLAMGVSFMLEKVTVSASKIKVWGLLIVIFIFMEMFGWYHVRDFYNINHPEIVEAGRAVEAKTPEKSLLIAPYNGDTAFLYQTRRAGWPIMQEDIEKMIGKGAQFYVSVNFDDFTKQLINEATTGKPEKRRFKLVDMTEKYVLIQLVPDNKLPK
ncbi:O-antigen ligase family protein [Candidatus Gottesmanbacteria bacterium]|nr:O-antigen ligase family protein [Candidatus Gottesmanbacteria bacterium]